MKKIFLSAGVIVSLLFFGCGTSQEKKQEESMPPPDTSKGVSASSSIKASATLMAMNEDSERKK